MSLLQNVSPLVAAAIYALIPTVVAIAATIVAAVWKPNRMLRSGLLHVAAGVIVAVVALDLLPQVTRARGDLPWIIGGFVLGVAVMLGVRWLDKRDEQESEGGAKKGGAGGWPVGLIAGNAVDQIVGGVVLGVGLAAGQNLGALLSLSMTIEDLSFGLAIAAVLGAIGATRGQMVWTTTWLGLLFVAVAVAAAAALHILPRSIVSLLLAFGSAALLFVVLEELIVQAHKARQAPVLAASLFAGFLLILVLGMLAGTSGG